MKNKTYKTLIWILAFIAAGASFALYKYGENLGLEANEIQRLLPTIFLIIVGGPAIFCRYGLWNNGRKIDNKTRFNLGFTLSVVLSVIIGIVKVLVSSKEILILSASIYTVIQLAVVGGMVQLYYKNKGIDGISKNRCFLIIGLILGSMIVLWVSILM